MYAKIKQLADEAIALQNKNRMDEVLREISAHCNHAMENNSYTGPGPGPALALTGLVGCTSCYNAMCTSGPRCAAPSTIGSGSLAEIVPGITIYNSDLPIVGNHNPNPVVLDGPVGEFVAPSAEADAYIAAHVAPATEPVTTKPGKKGGAK